MTRDALILAALPAVIRNSGYLSEDAARACLGSSTSAVITGTLELADAMLAELDKEHRLEQ